jgi:hypothetical protein
LSSGKFSTAADVWSFGIVVWEIFTLGNVPYPGIPNQEVASKVMNGYKMDVTSVNCSEKWKQIMNKCWLLKPENRPTFASMSVDAETDKVRAPLPSNLVTNTHYV